MVVYMGTFVKNKKRPSKAIWHVKMLGVGGIVWVWLLLLAGCASPEAPIAPTTERVEHSVTLGYSNPGLIGGQESITRGLIDHAERKGWRVIVANANSDPDIQASQIEYLISLGVDALVATPVDSERICASVARAREAGILFYTIDRTPVGCEVNMTVLSDNYLAGVQAGEAMVALLTGKYGEPRGVLLELQGDLQTNVAVLRGAGFHSVVNRYPDIRVISRETDWQASRFAAAAREVLSNTNIDGIYLHSDAIGIPEVLPVLEHLGKKIPRGQEGHIFITSVDANPVGLEAIRAGYADQASSQPIPDFGLIVNWIEKELNGEPIQAGEVVEEGALWSPATVERGRSGWQLILATTSVTIENVDHPALWGNQQPVGRP